jgi:hypothetical protein
MMFASASLAAAIYGHASHAGEAGAKAQDIPGAAQHTASVESIEQQRQGFDVQLYIYIQPGIGSAEFLQRARSMYLFRDANRDGKLSEADFEQRRRAAVAATRRNVMSQLLRHDDNADGVVTRDEIVLGETRSRARLRGDKDMINRFIEQAVTSQMEADSNGDGRIESEEMLEFASNRAANVRPPEVTFREFLSLDENGDGATDSAEHDRRVERFFRSIDADGDHTLSQQEANVFLTRMSASDVRRTRDAARLATQRIERELRARERATPRASEEIRR